MYETQTTRTGEVNDLFLLGYTDSLELTLLYLLMIVAINIMDNYG